MKSIKQSLKIAGMQDKEATILNWFFENQGGTSREIERTLLMRQPEVSMITSDFQRRKWIAYSAIKKQGKGRPEKRYRMLKTKEAILGVLADSLVVRIQELQEAEKTLRDAYRGN